MSKSDKRGNLERAFGQALDQIKQPGRPHEMTNAMRVLQALTSKHPRSKSER